MRVRTAADLGALIRDRRRQLGMDQRALAEKAGVSRYWVIGVESGKPRAEVGLVLRALRALDLTMDVEAVAPAHEARTKPGASRPKPPRVDLDALIGSLSRRKDR